LIRPFGRKVVFFSRVGLEIEELVITQAAPTKLDLPVEKNPPIPIHPHPVQRVYLGNDWMVDAGRHTSLYSFG
jgi:hypothetical protein